MNATSGGRPRARGLAGLGPVTVLLVLTAILPLDARALSAGALEQIELLLKAKAARGPALQKLDTRLWLELLRRRGDPLFDALPDLRTRAEVAPDGSVLVDIRAELTPGLMQRMVRGGVALENAQPAFGRMRARVPLSGLESLARSPRVHSVRSAIRPLRNMIDVSEGDVAHRAADVRSVLGLDGSGVMVCALSDSVDALADLQTSGDLPPAVTVLPGQSGNPGTSEGTAMLEIIFDLAPGADLGFATAFSGQGQFAQNILDLRAAGCDVLVDDVIYLDEPVFQDGIVAQAVRDVVADGAVYFSSAGNSGNLNDGTSGVWEGDFVPASSTSSGLTHAFQPGSDTDTILADPPAVITLQWSDPFGGSGNDYDLFLLDPTGTTIFDSSLGPQDGDDDPIEIINSGPFNDTGNTLVIVQFSGSARFLHMNTHRGRLSVATDGQIFGHAAAEEALAVAAVNVAQAGGGAFAAPLSVETFSSDGPRRVYYDASGAPLTPDNLSASGGIPRPKPDLSAADGVSTATPGFSTFFGTSAAAPHTAAIAALLLQADPELPGGAVRARLAQTAIDIEAPGQDGDSGFGVVDAFAAVEAVLPVEVPSAGGPAGHALLGLGLLLALRLRSRARSGRLARLGSAAPERRPARPRLRARRLSHGLLRNGRDRVLQPRPSGRPAAG